MKYMMKLGVALMLIGFMSQSSFAQFRFGGGLTLADHGSSSFGIQAKGIFNVAERVDIAGTFNYFFEDLTTTATEGDVHYHLIGDGDTEGISISGVGGIRYTRIDEFDTTALQLGLFGIIPTESVTVYVEPKWVLDEGSGFVISGGVIF